MSVYAVRRRAAHGSALRLVWEAARTERSAARLRGRFAPCARVCGSVALLFVVLALSAAGPAAADDAATDPSLGRELVFAVDPLDAETVGRAMRDRLSDLGERGRVEVDAELGRVTVLLGSRSAREPVIDALRRVGGLSYHLVLDDRGAPCRAPTPTERCLAQIDPSAETLRVAAEPLIADLVIAGARVERSAHWGAPVVLLRFTAAGTEAFCAVSAAHRGERIALVSDDVILSAAAIMEPVCGGQVMISGDFDADAAEAIAAQAAWAPYRTEVILVSERVVPVPLSGVERLWDFFDGD